MIQLLFVALWMEFLQAVCGATRGDRELDLETEFDPQHMRDHIENTSIRLHPLTGDALASRRKIMEREWGLILPKPIAN